MRVTQVMRTAYGKPAPKLNLNAVKRSRYLFGLTASGCARLSDASLIAVFHIYGVLRRAQLETLGQIAARQLERLHQKPRG